MISLDFTQSQLEKIITHYIGIKNQEQDLKLSDAPTSVDEETEEFLLNYFLHPFKNEELFNLFHKEDLNMNPVYTAVKEIFEDQDSFITQSKKIAEVLHDRDDTKKSKDGELSIIYLSDLILGGEVVDAIGIFKSENTSPFLKMSGSVTRYTIRHDYGYDLKGVDKACVIFNTSPNKGYIALAVDKSAKAGSFSLWKSDFLGLKTVNNEYQMTTQLLTAAKDFVTSQLPDEVEIEKADQIDLLNRSVKYFKEHDNYDKDEFEEEVLQDDKIIKSFRNYNDTKRQENDIYMDDNFEISDNAVKKQAKIFKKVLKLDKNFHVYIHGDKEQIIRGVDPDGRKFYKLYYNQED